MKPRDLKELIEQGESTTLEFKRKISSPEKIAKEITAFANTIGGYLLIGVDDDGTIRGIESEKSDIDLVEHACRFHISPPIEPEIEVANIYDLDVLVVYVAESPNKPHKVSDDSIEHESALRAYIRVGEKSVIASREMTRVLAGTNVSSKPVTLSIGDKERRLFVYLETHEKVTVKEFATLVNISVRRAERLLVRLVKAGVMQIHVDTAHDYFTLRGKLKV